MEHQLVACLTLTTGAEAGQRYLLRDLTVFEGGRSPGNHICLRDDSVAHSHFRIYKKGEEYTLHDLGSSKGTKINGKPVEQAVLAPGDRVKAGEVELIFDFADDSAGGRAASSAPDCPTERPIEIEEKPVEVAAEKPAREDKEDVGDRLPALVIIDGKDKGRTFLLTGKDRFKVGRAMGSDLKLSDAKISREHCLLETVRDHHIIIDLESSNGTVVNGERVKKTVLKEGDYIRLGFTLIRYDRV